MAWNIVWFLITSTFHDGLSIECWPKRQDSKCHGMVRCTFDASGVGSCQTGDCGGKLECDGLGATPLASLRVGLQVVVGDGEWNVVACKSACEVSGLEQYCCAGEFANPTTCRPFYSSIFKRACPRAYSYAYDDGTSTFTCKASDYTITFCSMNGVKETQRWRNNSTY